MPNYLESKGELLLTRSTVADEVSGTSKQAQHMSTTGDYEDNEVSDTCANCGKESNSSDMNTCNKCKSVKYCNAACKKKHRQKHKKQCERLRQVTELHNEKLFEQPPPKEDCPICIIRLPTLVTGRRYMSCCGKLLCSGCVYAPVYDHRGNIVKKRRCPFCRAPYPTSVKENIQRYKKRVEMGDAAAMQKVGECYSLGKCGLPQDMTKALELWHQAAELGCAEAYLAVGYAYYNGKGVEIDKKKANHYYELAAMGGNEVARFNLSGIEASVGNFDRALKHLMIAVRDGDARSLKEIQWLFSGGFAKEDDAVRALHLYQDHFDEIKSDQRERIDDTNVGCCYYDIQTYFESCDIFYTTAITGECICKLREV